MSKVIFADRASSTLAANASIGATTILIQSGDASTFGTINAGEVLYAVLSVGSEYEIITITGISGNSLTCSPLTRDWVLDSTRVIATLPSDALSNFVRESGDGQELSGYKISDYTEKTTDHGDIGSGETLTLSFGDGPFHQCNLTGNCTIAVDSNSLPETGKADTIVLDVVGVNLYTITWGSGIEASNEFPSTLTNKSRFLLTAKNAETDIDLVYSGGLSVGYPKSVDDDFTGDDGDAPNSMLWRTYVDPGVTFELLNNKLRFNSSGSANLDARANSKFTIGNAFDIQVDFEISTMTAPTSSISFVLFQILNEAQSAGFYIARARTGTYNGYLCWDSVNGLSSWDTSNSQSTGKLRFTRSGSSLKAYLWDGTRWEWGGSTNGYTSGYTLSEPMVIRMLCNQDFNSTLTADYDNFKLNSGTIVWP